jgi:hypothetical protein
MQNCIITNFCSGSVFGGQLPGDYQIKLNWETREKPDSDAETVDLEETGTNGNLEKVYITSAVPTACRAGAKYLLIAVDVLEDNSL